MAIQFASERKEDVANLLLALRYNLTYAAMYPDFITSMTQGGGVSVFDDTVSAAIQMALGAGEAPPTEGSAPPAATVRLNTLYVS